MRSAMVAVVTALIAVSNPAGARAADAIAAQPDDLRRQADWGASFEDPRPTQMGARIRALGAGSALAAAGFAADDLLIRVEDRLLDEPTVWSAIRAAARGGDSLLIEAQRADRRFEKRVTLPAAPLEAWPGLETEYGSVLTARGLRQRVLVTRPLGARAALPAILFVPWLSCDSIEEPGTGPPRDIANRFLYEVGTRSGWVLARIEKPGVGDSEGNCAETDFETELAGHRAALAALRRHPWVDPRRIVLMGQSYAGGILPLVDQGSRDGVADSDGVVGYAVINSWVGTWYERLLAFERLRLERSGAAPDAATEEMRALTEIYSEYLLRGRTPGEVFAERPHLRRYWDDGDRHQYGRPAAFYQQIQALNLAVAWQTVRAPVLAVWGDRDIVMHRAEHERLVAWANQRSPGAGELVIVPGMDHGLAVTAEGTQRLAEPLVTSVLEWLARRAQP